MNTPQVFLSYQNKWVADTSPVKVWEKSRRIGASWSEAGDDALFAASQNGADVWYIGYNKEMAQEFISDCGVWAKHYALAAEAMEEDVFKDYNPETDDTREILIYRVRFASGHEIVALSSSPRGLRGKQGRVVIDEAAFHTDLPGLLKAALALLMWGGQVRVMSTHNGDANDFNDLVGDVRAGKKPYSLHRTDFDQALEAGLFRRVCLRLGKEWTAAGEAEYRQTMRANYGDDAEEELDVVPRAGGGAYLSRQLIESRMTPAPVLRLAFDDAFTRWQPHLREAEVRDWCERELAPLLAALNPSRNHSLGEDFGRSVDLTVLAPFEEGQDLVRRAPFLVELRNVPFEQQKQILFFLCDRLPRFMRGAMDARGNGHYLAEVAQQRYGERIEAVMLTTEWYRENMPAFKAAFQDATILLPRDAEVLDDLRAFRMEKGVAKIPDTARTKDAHGKQRHGDAAIALALGHWASRQDGVEYGYQPARAQDEDGGQIGRDIKITAGWGRRKGAW